MFLGKLLTTFWRIAPILNGYLFVNLCAFVRVSDTRDRGWGGDDAGDRDWGGDDAGDGSWGGVHGLQVNPLLRFDFHWNFLTQ
jgi:hypothetical protein